MLSTFCDYYSLVKWQTLKSRELATSFVWWHHEQGTNNEWYSCFMSPNFG